VRQIASMGDKINFVVVWFRIEVSGLLLSGG
jgi:hypothetical protein